MKGLKYLLSAVFIFSFACSSEKSSSGIRFGDAIQQFYSDPSNYNYYNLKRIKDCFLEKNMNNNVLHSLINNEAFAKKYQLYIKTALFFIETLSKNILNKKPPLKSNDFIEYSIISDIFGSERSFCREYEAPVEYFNLQNKNIVVRKIECGKCQNELEYSSDDLKNSSYYFRCAQCYKVICYNCIYMFIPTIKGPCSNEDSKKLVDYLYTGTKCTCNDKGLLMRTTLFNEIKSHGEFIVPEGVKPLNFGKGYYELLFKILKSYPLFTYKYDFIEKYCNDKIREFFEFDFSTLDKASQNDAIKLIEFMLSTTTPGFLRKKLIESFPEKDLENPRNFMDKVLKMFDSFSTVTYKESFKLLADDKLTFITTDILNLLANIEYLFSKNRIDKEVFSEALEKIYKRWNLFKISSENNTYETLLKNFFKENSLLFVEDLENTIKKSIKKINND